MTDKSPATAQEQDMLAALAWLRMFTSKYKYAPEGKWAEILLERHARLTAHAACTPSINRRLLDALNGMIGLVQLVQDRYPDFPVDNHRVIEAMSAAKEAEAGTLSEKANTPGGPNRDVSAGTSHSEPDGSATKPAIPSSQGGASQGAGPIPSVVSADAQETCTYCGESYPKPISYHHSTEECHENEVRNKASASSAADTVRCDCYVLPHDPDCSIFIGITQSGDRVEERRSGNDRRTPSADAGRAADHMHSGGYGLTGPGTPSAEATTADEALPDDAELLRQAEQMQEALREDMRDGAATPRTDAVEFYAGDLDGGQEAVPADFARQLERELTDRSLYLLDWYKAAAPYATPQALQDALASLRSASAANTCPHCGYGPGWSGLPECQQTWSGDPAYRPKYPRCLLRATDRSTDG